MNEAAEAIRPREVSRRCAAIGCVLAGAFADHSQAASWWCAYHARAHASDLPRITAVLNEHALLRDGVLRLRQLLADTDVPASHVWSEAQRIATEVGPRVGETPLHEGYSISLPVGETGVRRYLYDLETALGQLVSDAMRGARAKRS